MNLKKNSDAQLQEMLRGILARIRLLPSGKVIGDTPEDWKLLAAINREIDRRRNRPEGENR